MSTTTLKHKVIEVRERVFLIHLNKMLMMRIIIIAIRQVNGIVQIRFHNQPSYLQILSAQTYQILVLLDDSIYSVRFTTLPDGTDLSSTYELEVPLYGYLIGIVCQPQPAPVNPPKSISVNGGALAVPRNLQVPVLPKVCRQSESEKTSESVQLHTARTECQ